MKADTFTFWFPFYTGKMHLRYNQKDFTDLLENLIVRKPEMEGILIVLQCITILWLGPDKCSFDKNLKSYFVSFV